MLKVEKDTENIFEQKELLKQNILLAKNPLGVGGLTQGKKKEKRKRKREKERKIIVIRRILQIQNVSLVAKWDIFAGKVLLYRDKNPRQLTPGLSSSSNSSSGLDLSSPTATTVTPDVPVAQIPTGVASPLP